MMYNVYSERKINKVEIFNFQDISYLLTLLQKINEKLKVLKFQYNILKTKFVLNDLGKAPKRLMFY